jgi:conjugative relaxase-like TrwC/TraI family protein
MLRIRPVTSASDAKSYYAQADYYAEGQETVGRWGGKLAEKLGLSGTVDKERFDQLCDNINPVTGKTLTPRTNENRRVGYDMVYAGPKSFSVLVGVGPDDVSRQCKAIFDRAVEQTQAEIEADMQTRVRKDGAHHDRTTGSMLWAGFDHSTSRPVDGGIPDPQWHRHVFCLNATEDTVEGRIKAGEFSGILRDKAYYEAAFFSRLAKGLADRGFAIDRRAGGKWEIAGVPQSVIDLFSKRTDEIEAAAERLGITDAKRKGELGAKTRSKKKKELTPDQLRVAWDAQLSNAERKALAAVYARDVAGRPVVTPAEAVSFAIRHLSEQQSVFPERELMRVAMLHGLGGVTPGQVAAELPRHGVLADVIDGRRMATTEALQAEERYLVGLAAKGRGLADPVGLPAGLERGKLNDGQWQAVQSLLGSTNVVNLVEGPAGAGKSTLLAAYDRGMRLSGEKVTYLATTAAAVKVLADDGFDSHTVARFLLDERMQKAAAGGRVVIDETSMLGHKDAVRLFGIVQKYDLKLIFVGDPMQHASVARGALMRILKDHAGIRPFKLSEIIRQKGPEYRAAATLLSEGHTADGFAALDRLGWVKELGDDSRYRQMATDYVQALKDGIRWNDLLVISPTHAEAGAITSAIRGQLRAAGLLDDQEHAFTRLVATNASEAERGLATTYKPGDVLVFHQNAKGGFKKGDRLAVSNAATLPLSEAAKFSVYRTESIGLAVGDVIRFTSSVKTRDGRHTLRNGAAHAVAEITAGGNLRLDNGWLVPGDAGFFRHGRVETSMGSQGRTVKRAFVGMAASSSPAINQEQMYVSASRAKERMTLYTDDKAAILHAIKRSSQKLAALDLAAKPSPKPKRREQERQRKRRLAYLDRLRAAWPLVRRLAVPRRLAAEMETGVPLSHAERQLHQRQGKDIDHGWGL